MASCGTKKQDVVEQVVEDAPENVTEVVEVAEDFEEFDKVANEDGKFSFEKDEQDVIGQEQKIVATDSDDMPSKIEQAGSIISENGPEMMGIHKPIKIDSTTANYQVEKNGETLMWIAFKLYGDYKMWHELASLNSSKLLRNNAVPKGITLQYHPPVDEFIWRKNGNPYLIKKGDTLGKISSEVYGRTNKWRDIWNNNRPMIQNPNRIFAGFTLYYIPDEGKLAKF